MRVSVFGLIAFSALHGGASGSSSDGCMAATNLPKTMNLGWWGSVNNVYKNSGVWGATTMKNYFSSWDHCREMIAYSAQNGGVAGAYVGSMVQNHGAGYTIMTQFYNDVMNNGMQNAKFLQYCETGEPAKTVGIIVDATNNQNAVKNAIKDWSQGKCWNDGTGSKNVPNSDLWFTSYADRKSGQGINVPDIGECRYVKVIKGVDVSVTCGVNSDEVRMYNPGVNMNTLQPGQPICCSVGKLPDMRPKPNPDGSCVYHTIAKGESCSTLTAMYYPLSVSDLMEYNKNTYGWYGCGYEGHPWVGDKICVSSGTPPRPTPTPGAMCGPLAPGDKYNSECPLNACCSFAGYCGLDKIHCETKNSPTGAPGTTGCFSNCGMTYKATSGPPSEFIKVGFWEEWNWKRPCQNSNIMDVQYMVDTLKYTEIHYSFAIISDYKVSITNMTTFNNFLSLKNTKKVLSFGGWAFSTEDATRPIFGDAVLTEQFVNSVVEAINTYKLDGIEIDWEYPGATDLKGWAGSTPTVHPNDGANYLNFLQKLKPAMPSGTTLSICAPSSFWYLQHFPIADMAKTLDYIMFMTYDLHGQWDYNIPSTGPYLRSHVNKTETIDSLTLITKAGVPSNKIVMGVASYGRSFKQTNPSCYTPECTFTGPDNGATPGKCTQTAGYISFGELQNIVDNGVVRKQYYDEISGSNIMLYNTNDWVAYTNVSTTLNDRYTMAKSMNLLGTGEWAVDLRRSEINTYNIFYKSYDIEFVTCPEDVTNLDDALNLPDPCVVYGIVQALSYGMQKNITSYTTMMAGSQQCTWNPASQGEMCYNYNHYKQLYSDDYVPYVTKKAQEAHLKFFDNATVNPFISAFDRYIDCGGSCDVGATVKLKVGEKVLYSDMNASMNTTLAYKYGDFGFKKSFNDDEINYNNFPLVDPAVSFPDPSSQISDNMANITAVADMLKKSLDDPDNTDYEYVLNSTIYTAISFMNAVNQMSRIVEIGNQIEEWKAEQALRFFLEIIIGIVEIVVALVPVVGEALSASIAVVYGAVTGDTNPLDYILAGAASMGKITSLFKEGKGFKEITGDIKNIREKNPNAFKILDSNKDIARIRKMQANTDYTHGVCGA